MRTLIFCLALLACLALPGRSLAMDLSAFQGNSRLLLVFAPAFGDERLEAVDKLAHREMVEVLDRDLVIMSILPDGGFADGPLSAEDARSLRREFAIPDGAFEMVLLGKDGEEKARYTTPEGLLEAFEDIDRMPMRQMEMRRNRPTY